MPNVVDPNPWSSETLLAKAQLYLEQMNETVAEDWRFGLWSALSLEFLARAALAHVSPILLANPQNWRNIMHALGKAPTTKRFSPTSIGTKEVLARLSEIFPEFNQETAGFCSQHVERRNAELHSGELVFSGLGTAEWLPKYYRACHILLSTIGKKLDDFIADPDNAMKMIASLDGQAAKEVKQDINAHEKVWSNKTETERETAVLQATTWATRHAGHRVACPACQTPALLQGSPSGPVSTKICNDEVIQKQTMLPSSFECIACGLKIAGFSKLSAYGLGNVFTGTTTYTAAEFFDLYTEDELEEARNEHLGYEPDFNDY